MRRRDLREAATSVKCLPLTLRFACHSLGFPWFLAILIKDGGMDYFPVCKDGIQTAVAILFCTVLLFVGVLAINKWMMNTTVGIGLFALYMVYVIYTIISAATTENKCDVDAH